MATVLTRVTPLPRVNSRPWHLVERNFLVYRHDWVVFVSGFFEPLFYLLSIGVGISQLVGEFPGPDGRPLSYTSFVAPAMLAASAMNGAIFDSTYNIFFKLKYAKTYDAMLSTPMSPRDAAIGEITWALLRGTAYAAGFIVVMAAMRLTHSWWSLLALPTAVLIGFAFAGVGMAATTWMRSWQDFQFVQLAILPLFLFSATFFPLQTYPPLGQLIVQVTPLYHGVALVRGLTTGVVEWGLLVHVAYLSAMGVLGLYVASRRLSRLLLR